MSLFFEMAEIEIVEPGKVICIAGNETLSTGIVASLEYKRLGNVVAVDLDSLIGMPLPDRAACLRSQLDLHFPEWSDYPYMQTVTERIVSGSGHLYLLRRVRDDRQCILPIITYEGRLFSAKLQSHNNIPYADLLKRIMLLHEIGHLEALIESDLSHGLFSERSSRENHANIYSMRQLGIESPDLFSYGVTGLIAWQAYSYLFRNSFPSCGYVAEADYAKYLLEDKAAVPLTSSSLQSCIRGINHVAMTWLFHHQPHHPDVLAYRSDGDCDAAAAYLLQQPEKRALALTCILKRLRNDDPLDENEHVSDEQVRLIERSLVGFSLFAATDLPDGIFSGHLKREMEDNFRTTPEFPHTKNTALKRNHIIFVHP